MLLMLVFMLSGPADADKVLCAELNQTRFRMKVRNNTDKKLLSRISRLENKVGCKGKIKDFPPKIYYQLADESLAIMKALDAGRL